MLLHTLLSLLVGLVASQTVDDCPAGLPRNQYLDIYNGYCFEFVFSIKRDFIVAEGECEKLGGTLAFVKTAADQAYVFKKIQELGPNLDRVWIGLNDRATEETFLWLDGTPVTYENWSPNDGPNNYVTGRLEDCVAINAQTGEWEDLYCESGGLVSVVNDPNHEFICQYPIASSK